MKVRNIFSLLLAALLVFMTFTACNNETGDPQNTENVSTSDATQAPETEATHLDETAAKALLSAAMAASEASTAYENTVHCSMSMSGVTSMDITYTEATDGDNYRLSANLLGLDMTYTFVGDVVYVTLPAREDEGEGEKYAVTLTPEQKEEVISQGVSSETIDVSALMVADAFTGLSGERQADGSVILTASDVSNELKETIGAGGDYTVTIKACTFTVNKEGLVADLSLTYTLEIPETDYSAAMSMETKLSQSTVYEGVRVAAPEDIDSYAVESYEAVFEGSVPMNGMITAAGMPLDGDQYVIDTTTESDATDAQGQLLYAFPHLYAGKAFTVTATVGIEDVLHYVTVGDSVVYLDFPMTVFEPMVGDVITATVVLKQIFDGEENDLAAYAFYFDSYQLVERAAGPNGGTYMYVNVNSSLNVRPVPTTADNSPIGSFARGEIVEVLEIVDGWAMIVYEEAEDGYAYVSAQYLVES